jgi:hypothetical protein
MQKTFVVVALIGSVGCATEPDVTPAFKCSTLICGANSPVIDHYGFHDLNLDHVPNAAGFVVLGVTHDNVFYDLDVRRGALQAIGPDVAIAGGALAGATIWLERDGKQYGIVIAGVGGTFDVVSPFEPIETYALDWAAVVARPLPPELVAGTPIENPPEIDATEALCPNPPDWHGTDFEWDESTVMQPYDVLVFEGDRIDSAAKTVAHAADDRWFNFGCARDTLAKLRLTRNTLHTVESRDWRHVQATLKMLTADYCGTGTPFTVTGEPLVWHGRVGMPYWAEPKQLEARWTEAGATCLDAPRLVKTALPAAQAEFGDIEAAISAECRRLPPCPNHDPFVFASNRELVTSGNY